MFLLLASLLLAFEYADTSHPDQTSLCNNSLHLSYLYWRPQELNSQNILEDTLLANNMSRLCGWAKMGRTQVRGSATNKL